MEPILFFDGECVLCNGTVDTLMRLDRERRFKYAPLQGTTADDLRNTTEGFPTGLDTFVYVDADGASLRSAAVFAVARHLPYPWRMLSWFRILPRFLTDAVYNLIAKNRIKWFGQKESCRMPTQEEVGLLLP